MPMSERAWVWRREYKTVLGAQGRGSTMRDMLFIGIIVVFFVLCAFYVRALDRS
jgi:hypothetical protein